VCHNVRYNGDTVGAGREHDRGSLGSDSTDGDEGTFDPCSPLRKPWETLRRTRHFLQHGSVDRSERHVVGLRGKRSLQFLKAVGANADSDARRPDGGKVGVGEVLLAKMHEVGLRRDRLTPIVVDHKLTAMRGAEGDSPFDLGTDLGAPILDAKLNELDALRQEAREPIRIRDDGVKRIEMDQEA